MAKEDSIKIIPAKPQPLSVEVNRNKIDYVLGIIVLTVIYFVLLVAVSFLPLSWYMQILALILGAFLIFDLHHSIKHYVQDRQ